MHPRQLSTALLLPLILGSLGSGALLAGCGSESGASEDGLGGLAILDPQHPAHANWVDLGDILLGETVRYEVPLENREPGPLTIRSIQSGCSCAVPSIYYQTAAGEVVHGQMNNRDNVLTIPEGEVAMLLLEVDSRRSPTRNKAKLVVVRIVSDSPTAPYLSLDVRMLIDAPFVAVPAALDFGRVATNGGGQGLTRVLSEAPGQPHITGVLSTSEGLTATIEETNEMGRLGWIVKAVYAPPVPLGYRELQIELETSGPGGEGTGRPLVIPVHINGVPDFEVRPSRLLLQPTNPGEADTAESALVAHMPGLRFLIEDVVLSGERLDDLAVSFAADRPDITGRSSRWVLRLEALTDLGDEGCSGTVTVTTDNPEIGTLEVPFVRLPKS